MNQQTISTQQQERSELFAALGLARLRSEQPSSKSPTTEQRDTLTSSLSPEPDASIKNNERNDETTAPKKPDEKIHDFKNVNKNTDDNKIIYSDLSFTEKLYRVLHDDRYQDIIRFAPGSDAFIQFVDKKKLREEVLPLIFNETNFQSFIRSMTRWNFYKVTKGQYAESYYHEYFRKNKPNLCARISSKGSSSKGEKSRASSIIKHDRLKENQTNIVCDIQNVRNRSVMVTTTAVPEEEAVTVPPSVHQEEVPSNTFLHQIQEPVSSSIMTMISSIPAASGTSSNLSSIQLLRRDIELRMLLELHQRTIEINQLNLLSNFVAEAQTLNTMVSRLPASNYESAIQLRLLNSPLRDLIIHRMNGGNL